MRRCAHAGLVPMDEPLLADHLSRNDLERELLRRVHARDREAFRELYIAYHRRLARFLMRVTRRYEIAEEIINDTMWIVWRQAGSFRHESRVSTWILGIAYRRTLKALRDLDVHGARRAVDLEDEALTAPDEFAQSELHEWLLRGLDKLPLEQRMVLEFAYDLGNSCEEIAVIMECPVNTVKTRLFHARRKLREILPALAGVDRL